MTSTFPPEDLECPDAGNCPVDAEAAGARLATGDLHLATFAETRTWVRVYDARDGFGTPNPGYGDTRFAPFDDLRGRRVPTFYLAQSLEAALLETVLHDVSHRKPRLVSEKVLHGKLHVAMAGQSLRLVDLRDDELGRVGLERSSVASSPAEHYPCTRRIAKLVHSSTFDGQDAAGLVWHSRQAELTGKPQQEVAVVFADRVNTDRQDWGVVRSRSASGALLEGYGRALFDETVEQLGITVIGDFDT